MSYPQVAFSYKNGPFETRVVIDSRTGHLIVEATNSVVMLIYLTDLEKVVMVEQLRPASATGQNPNGLAREFPAGRLDCDLTPLELVTKEAEEEVGVIINSNEIIWVNQVPLYLSIGMSTEQTWLTYAEITSDRLAPDRVFGEDGSDEEIHRVLVSIEEL